MKKQISMTLAAIIFALSLASCTGPGKATSPFDDTDTDDESVTTTEGDSFFYQGNPDYDYKNVDERRRLDNYVLDTVDEPWGETHDLHWVNGPIKNYFIYYTFNDYDEINNVNLNNISTISRPRVRVFPADKDGYVMYEVTYTQSFPIRSMEKGHVSSSMYSFYGVRYIDYYTGTMLPYMNVFDKDRSGGVDIDFVYEGESYSFGFYQFKDQDEEDEGYDTDAEGNIITKRTISVTRTDYIIVPEDYDGLLMSVYVADWVSEPQDEDGDGNDDNKNPNREPVTIHDPEPFDDEENIDDYVFFGVTGPK